MTTSTDTGNRLATALRALSMVLFRMPDPAIREPRWTWPDYD